MVNEFGNAIALCKVQNNMSLFFGASLKLISCHACDFVISGLESSETMMQIIVCYSCCSQAV